MSRRLLTGIGLIACALLVLCAGVVVAGRAQPPPDRLAGLQRCDGRPCYYGIVPGITSWADAEAILRRTPGVIFESSTNLGQNYHGPDGDIRLDRVAVDAPVDRVSLLPAAPNIPVVGTILGRFGTPCSIVPNVLLARMQVFAQGLAVLFEPVSPAQARSPHPSSPVLSIVIVDMAEKMPCGDFEKTIPRWRGFRHY